AVVREPIIGSYRDYKIIGAPPPSSGGIAIVQGLNMVEAVDLPREKFTPKTLHLLAEVSRRFFLDRARHLGDPDFAKIPEHLTSKSYAKQLVSLIDHLKATESASLADDIEIADESDDTTHFSIIDASGMAVSNTYTLEASWGSRIVVPGAGYLLNNEMGDFNWKKGYTDRLGRIGTENNLIKPGKRMLSSQCPLIVTKDDQVILVTGSPGGRTIINTVFNIVLNVLHYEMPVPQAVQSRRFHHQWMPDLLTLENAEGETFDELRSELEAMGHRINDRPSQGSAHTIGYDPTSKRMVGVADYRRGGRPAGISSSRLTRWDFGGRAGTSLDRQAATGNRQMFWSNSISGCATDGEDRLTIRRDGSSMPNQTHIRCPAISDTCELSIEFDRLRFAGPDRDEELRFAFI
ncbi:MAG: gamma-glutamyltransferase, partial [Planctomycetota bacterium]